MKNVNSGSELISIIKRKFKVTMWATMMVMLVTTAAIWLGTKQAKAQTPGAAAAPTPPAANAPVAAAPMAGMTNQPALPAYFAGLKQPDPTGANYGVWPTPSGTPNTNGTPGGDVPSQLNVANLYDMILHGQYASNIIWTLIEGFLVFFMQLGFAMLESGFSRAKNANHTFAMTLMIFAIATAAYWVYGFALGWGNWFNGPAAPGWYPSLGPGLSMLSHGWGLGAHGDGSFKYGLIGTGGFCLTSGFHDVGVLALFFFMSVFMETGVTIPTGAMAERWNWGNFCLFAAFSPFIYCVFAAWVWGGGWLAQGGVNWHLGNGACDFAGSGVVHCVGGMMALAGCIVMGPRLGKYVNGKPVSFPGHNLPFVMGGTLLLAFGWLGFNPGSTLAGTDLRISFVVVNTVIASVIGSIVSMFVMWQKTKKWDPAMMCNGMLAGLVAITAPCAFVTPIGAALIGVIAGILVVYSTFFFEMLGIDDVAGAISVHGACGAWGVISVGLFACGEYGAGYNGVATPVIGLFYGGGVNQLLMQLIDLAALVTWAFTIMYVWMKFSNLIIPIRPSEADELKGLDATQLGAPAYPDFAPATQKPEQS
ncbi:MAG TPA: ammonium transporter [Candidatus Baltobacteraceae bacterium]|jgi:Amt family ammonium transporter|nr:ammonium transporter [Candidatus Baltobacteraceae bacterium]